MKRVEWEIRVREALKKYKYVLLVILVGILLLAWPAGEDPEEAPARAGREELFQAEQLEERLERALSKVEGAGEVTVVLTLQGGPRQVLVQDGAATEEDSRSSRETETLLGSRGSGYQEPVVLQELGPVYQGALLVYSGEKDPGVELELYGAVSALTGLRADQISICKGK